MVTRYALVACLHAAVASAQWTDDYSSTSTSAFWTYTARVQEAVTLSLYTDYYYSSDVETDTFTTTRTIKDSVTPTVTPTDVFTNAAYYDNVNVVWEYYPSGAVAESDLVPVTTYDYSATTTSTTTYTDIDFSMPVTMTAPASCPTPFTVTTSASVTIPSVITSQLKPVSTASGSTSTGTGYYRGTVFEYATWYLSENAAPFETSSDYYYSYYIASCSTPPVAYTTGTRSGGGSGSGSNFDDDSDSGSSSRCYYSSYYCGTPLRTYIIVIATLIPGLFLLGFLESWFWFRRLMLGKSAMRLGTVSWVFISLWILCFTRMQDKRSKEDQKVLAENWKNMGSGAAFKAWWKWGFRHKYPEELLGQYSPKTVGIVPPGQPMPGMAQTPAGMEAGTSAGHGPVYYYGPPPPGWVQGPNGQFIPPQGYMYPPPNTTTPNATGYYGNAPKDGGIVSQSPGPHPSEQQTSTTPQAPQQAHTAPPTERSEPTPYGAPPNVGPLPSPSPVSAVSTPPPSAPPPNDKNA